MNNPTIDSIRRELDEAKRRARSLEASLAAAMKSIVRETLGDDCPAKPIFLLDVPCKSSPVGVCVLRYDFSFFEECLFCEKRA